MELFHDEASGVAILRLNGRLDAVTAPTLEHRCGKLMEEGKVRIVLDMAQLEYTSRAGLRAILSIAQRLKARKGGFAMCALPRAVEEVFNVSGFTLYLPIHDSCPEAVAAIREAPEPPE